MASHGSVPFFGGGAEVGSDAAEFDGARFGAKSDGDFLLSFHRSDVSAVRDGLAQGHCFVATKF